jgi:antitoxin YefM
MTQHEVSRSQTMAPLTEARDRLSEIIDDISTTGADLVITRHGRPVAVVISHDEYESMIETLNILSDTETMAALAEADADVDSDDLEDLD